MSDSPAVKASTLLPVKNINIAAVNINSITSPGRLDELQYFMDENHIDILAVSELKIDYYTSQPVYDSELPSTDSKAANKARRRHGDLCERNITLHTHLRPRK